MDSLLNKVLKYAKCAEDSLCGYDMCTYGVGDAIISIFSSWYSSAPWQLKCAIFGALLVADIPPELVVAILKITLGRFYGGLLAWTCTHLLTGPMSLRTICFVDQKNGDNALFAEIRALISKIWNERWSAIWMTCASYMYRTITAALGSIYYAPQVPKLVTSATKLCITSDK